MLYYFSLFLIAAVIVLSLRVLFIPQKIKGKKVSFENFMILTLIYLTVMTGFGLLYYLLELKGTGVLSVNSMDMANSSCEKMFNSLYFSASTLFSVGYGDIVPIGMGKGIAIIEALIGYTIPAAFVTRAVFDQNKGVS